MTSLLRRAIRKVVGEERYSTLQAARRDKDNRNFVRRQTPVSIRIGNFDLLAPSDHILLKLLQKQPKRDLAIGRVSKEVGKKYPGTTIVDVGANIGDTAAMIASYSDNPIIAIEPSDFYFDYLVKNAAIIGTVKQTQKLLVSNNANERGVLVHRGGTAQLDRTNGSGQTFHCKPLSEVADGSTRFIKVDTDGFDLIVLGSGLDLLERQKPILYYEVEIPDSGELETQSAFVSHLRSIGYTAFVIFDDAGTHIVSTNDIAEVRMLYRYLCETVKRGDSSLFNFDILCVSEQDEDACHAVTEFYKC